MSRTTADELTDLVRRAFQRQGVRADMAQDAASMLVTTEMMGIRTHGLAKVGPYVERLRDGGVDPEADPIVTAPAPALRQVDGRNGLGPAVALRGVRAAVEAARAAGMCASFCRGSSHLGALAPQLLEAAEAGCAALFVTNSAPMIAPPGGHRPVIGNTPLGIAVPDPATGRHVILDMALSMVARSKVRQAAARGEAIPDTWATDAEGRPTTDAAAAMQGLMLAIGGAKGAHLSLCLDLLAGGLSGAAMLSEVPNANLDTGAVANVGHMFVVIDVARLMPSDAVSRRVEDARAMLRAGAAEAADPSPRLPGARAMAELADARANGVAVEATVLESLHDLADG